MNDANNTQLFNTNQLSTWEQAREYATKLSAGPIVVGNGVKPETSSPATSGIYRPSWDGGIFQEPNHTDSKSGEQSFFLHYRFHNGAEGMNVGLIMDKFRRYPNSPQYVISALAAEASSMAR